MEPLFFSPILKRIRWGGRRLGTLLGKPIGPQADYAESWEVVDHGADQSMIAAGELAGWTLDRFVNERGRELFGQHAGLTQFPLLVKFLDANDRLSLQVHPDDAGAKMYDPQENGKTEAWVIVHAEPGSRLYAGLKTGIDRETFRRRLESGDLEDCLHAFEVKAGDCVFIPAGTVHAIAEGIVLAEIQQSSDLTFRLYDWGRLGLGGKPRELHIKQGLDVTDFQRGPVSPVTPRKLAESPFTEELVRCEYFVMHRHQSDQAFSVPINNRFHVLMMLDGHAILAAGSKRYPLDLGQTVLIPALCPDVEVLPRSGSACTVLDAFLP